jgi:MFS family permease
VFAVMGIGRSCLSTTTISTALAPWFELHQGRAVSMALLGASVGGIIGTPLLLGGIALLGVKQAFGLAALASTIVLLPVVALVLKRSPQELGLLPDGGLKAASTGTQEAKWSRIGAMRTRQFQSQLLAFALAMLVQIAFLSHHVSIVAPILGDAGASTAVSLAAASAFVGRVALAQLSDKIDLRLTTAGVMLLGTVALAYMSNATSAFSLFLASAMYGVTIGNLTTLSPLIARREFGAVSFGSIYGLIAAAIAFATAFGPAICGLLRDSLGSYGPPLLMFAGINLFAAGVIVWGGRKPMPQPS